MAYRKRRSRRRFRKSSSRPRKKLSLVEKLKLRFKNLLSPSGGIMAVVLMSIPFFIPQIKEQLEKFVMQIKSKAGMQ